MPERTDVCRRLERLAWLMDNSIPVPGLDYRIGLDGIIGLVPGLGDALGAVISSYILSEAARLGTPRPILLRMVFNIALDAVVGTIPILGDLFDFTWKANLRNVALLRGYLEKPRKTVAVSRLFIAILVLLVILFAGFLLLASALLLRWLWHVVSG
ncbi:MAG: DUF4112 domain-containing protein [Desulfobacteraceae bacterium]|nr:DUF4112 domain-containing protein [Desulfobacteraceae bacterium]